ncbi:MAG TPA: TIGR03032 family protein [Gemmataceae bacterium]|nr:TIGR03032 family protein [Gemmataceae bacterium]
MTEAEKASTPGQPEIPFRYVYTPGLAGLLEELGAALLVSTYQAGKLVVVRAEQGRLSTLLRNFEQAMGLAGDCRRLAVGTRSMIWFLRNAPDIAPQLEPAGRHDSCFIPRSCHVTGDVRIHEIAWSGETLWLVNTRFSCLCTLHPDYSFVPRWRPPFVTAFTAEDRCHLNGLAMVDGQPQYVTALGETDTPGGWRPKKVTGGCVIDVPSGQVVVRGLAMPHSPRVHDRQLWVLDSGNGHVRIVGPGSGKGIVVAELPGYPRGLAFCDRYAFVGLSKIRETSTFGGMPLAQRRNQLKCGVWVLDNRSGQVVEFLEFEKGVEEIFDVQILAGVRFPAVVGFDRDVIQDTFVVPPDEPKAMP